MERLFLKLISEENEVQKYVKSHYKLIMVDEFQDSNPIQLKIFNKLSELIATNDGHSYWVGDPKQAIYGFRGADTDLVNSVSNRFHFYNDADIHPEKGDNHLGSGRLVESWRSRKKLVELVNELFRARFKKEDHVNELCITLNPHFMNDTLKTKPNVHLECNESNSEKASEALANKVKEVLASKMLVHRGKLDEPTVEIEPKDIAILARTWSDIKGIVKALRKYGIPVAEPEDAIMQRVEVQLVVALLQYMQDSKNKHVIADILRLLCGKSTTEILKDRIKYVADNKNDKEEKKDWDHWMEDDAIINDLLAKTERFKHLSIPEIVRGLIYECNIPALTVKWGDEHIRKQNLSTLQHLADDYDEMCVQMGLGSSIGGFIYFLNSVEPDNEKDNQSNSVKVFTYHGSKGLEWPMVILYSLDYNSLEPNDFISKSLMRVREMVLEDRSTDDDPFAKDYYLHFYPRVLKNASGRAHVHDTLRDKIVDTDLYQTLIAKAKSEERRLLYVGMTRAKDYLYTFGRKENYAWLENVVVDNPTKDNLWGLDDYIPQFVEVMKPEDSSEVVALPTYEMLQKPVKHSLFERRYLAPSKIDSLAGYSSHQKWEERGNKLEDKGWGIDYATIGSCIHDIFAVYRPDAADENHQAAVNIIGGYGLADKMVGHVDAILGSAKWLYDTLQSHFPQTDADVRRTEYPFQLTLESGQTVRGEMDLLWFYTDEKGEHCVLVDYKSYEGFDLDEHTRKYYPQLSAYATALRHVGIDVTHALLYYPVHKIIHELSE
jgi:ATP-dependent exoDNAse (exonuclease V) beta subunit